ncbi:MAG: hypothetical protein ACYTE6_09890 [Planctomycetota bacterium]|jgi:hypothetical protein
MQQPSEQTAGRFPIRKALRLGAAALVVGMIVFLISSSREQRTVSEVIDEIHQIALDEPQGGLIGRWWVSAAGVDPDTGRLQAFKLECGPVHIAARSARVIVNHHTNSFQFEMWDVVMARVPDQDDPDDQDTLRVLDRFSLGPLPYSTDVVPDKPAKRQPSVTLTDD